MIRTGFGDANEANPGLAAYSWDHADPVTAITGGAADIEQLNR